MRVIAQLSDGLARILYNGESALWVRGRVRGRSKSCKGCGKLCLVGVSMYRPIADPMYRMDRLCTECVQGKDS